MNDKIDVGPHQRSRPQPRVRQQELEPTHATPVPIEKTEGHDLHKRPKPRVLSSTTDSDKPGKGISVVRKPR